MAEPSTMKVAELKDELKQLGVTDLRHCVEKDDLVAELRTARAKQSSAPAGTTAAGANSAPYNDGLRYGRVAVIGNTVNPTGLVLFLHGLGDTCDGWESELQVITNKHPHIVVVLPSAAEQPVSMNMGMRMPSWYDIKTLSFNGPEDLPGMQRTAAYMDHVLAIYSKKFGIAPDRVVFAGFSQGGCMSMFAGLTTKRGVPAGVMSLSGYLGNRQWVVDNCVNKVPVFMAHGRQDPVVPYALSQASKGILMEKCGLATLLEYNEYDMGHSATLEEFEAMIRWLTKVLPPS